MTPGQIEKVTVDGVALNVDCIGAGPPVLCLHAVGHDGHDFDALSERLRHSYRFIRLDWPGQGQSASDHVPASAARYAELADKLIDALGLVQPVILGNSIGGAAAIRIAARRQVSGLVLCDSGGLVEVTPTVARICRFFERFYAAGERGAWWFGPAFAFHYSMVLRGVAARAQRQRIVKAARKNARVLREAWASFGRPDADVRNIAAELDVPILVAWAKRDSILPLKYCRPAISRIKRHRLTTFEGGHSPFLEQPEAFAKVFKAFMKELRSHGLDPERQSAMGNRRVS
jgi:4,5:9,10-diseco-3-hydroxy-5,9,17-trioxoandrosta-1(10),2-diene-4-oate hydrolase